MVQRLKREYPQVPVSFELKKKTAVSIITALDKDENGTIEQEEFVQWVLVGAQKSRAERRAYAAQGDDYRFRTQFLEVIIRFARKIKVNQKIELLRPALMRIFYEASESNPEIGHVNADNLVQIVASLRTRYPTVTWIDMEADNMSTANLIIKTLDTDDNGTIEADEWVPWIIKGLIKTAVERQKFSESSYRFAKLIQFADSMGKVAEIMTAEILAFKPTLKKIFKDNATDGEHMSPNDILKLVENMRKSYPSIDAVTTLNFDADTAKIIVASLDSDQNGTIESDEWTSWLLKGMTKTTFQRDKFAQSGPAFTKLRDFLNAVQAVAEKLTKHPVFGVMAVVDAGETDTIEAKTEDRTEAAKPAIVVADPKQALRDRMKSEGVLKNVPALASLQVEHLEAIIDSMTYETYDEDNPLIIEQGTKADRFYIIAAGVVSIMASCKEGWPVERERRRELQYFGEECLLGNDNQRYSVSSVATGDVQVFMLNVKTNDIVTKNSAEVVAAANAARTQKIGNKYGKRFRQNFLQRKRKKAGKDLTVVLSANADAAEKKEEESRKENGDDKEKIEEGMEEKKDTEAGGTQDTGEVVGENETETNADDQSLVIDWG